MKKFRLKVDWKKVFRISLRVLVVSAFLVSFGFTEHRRTETACKAIEIHVDDSLGNSFVKQDDIAQFVEEKFGMLEGHLLSSINISFLEKNIDGNHFII